MGEVTQRSKHCSGHSNIPLPLLEMYHIINEVVPPCLGFPWLYPKPTRGSLTMASWPPHDKLAGRIDVIHIIGQFKEEQEKRFTW